MAQVKSQGYKGGPAQKHLHSRISYLYQAATLLAHATTNHIIEGCNPKNSEQAKGGPGEIEQSSIMALEVEETAPAEAPVRSRNEPADINLYNESSLRESALSRHLLTHLRAVSLKSVIRLTPAMKNSICKRCDLLMVPGSTATISAENKSRGSKKPWADVLVLTCVACGTTKRHPVGMKRQLKRQKRLDRYKAKTAFPKDG